MDRPGTATFLPSVVAALGRSEADPATRRLVEAFGGRPIAERERAVGEPVRRSRRLSFASGGEIILHDGAVAAVLLHLTPTSTSPHGLDLSEWMPGVDNDATLDDLKQATGASPSFAGMGTPYVALDGAFARFGFAGNRGWNDPGNLASIVVTAGRPGLVVRPEDDDCPACSDLLVRPRCSESGVDVDGTTASLAEALAAGRLTEDAHWVPLADLRPLHASGLMERVETQLTCTECRRIICFTLVRDGSPTFGHHVLNDATRRPLGTIPPVEQWGEPARIAEDRDAMHYVDHEPGAWFLVEQQGILYLDARYSHGSTIDDSALVRLGGAELGAYRSGGHDYLSDLARRIHDSAPYRPESPFHQRDLYRGPDGQAYRRSVSAAIVDHTWIAQQRRQPRP